MSVEEKLKRLLDQNVFTASWSADAKRLMAGWVTKIFDESRPCEEWIPCSDRLPEKDGDYIATYTFCDKQVVNKVHYSKHLGFFYNSVIAWVPLPKPYGKEGDEGGEYQS